jgi:hypothetical protein
MTFGSFLWSRKARRARASYGVRLSLEPLEDRTLPSSSPLLTALTTERNWVAYAPATTRHGAYPNPTKAEITTDLTILYNEGFRNLVTYTLQDNYSFIPEIAKNLFGKGIGFEYVIAGIYNVVNPSSPNQELTNATTASIAQYIDGYLVGNEGLFLHNPRYTIGDLQAEIAYLKGKFPDTPAATSEVSDAYLPGQHQPGTANPWDNQALLNTGDWVFPNINFFYFGNVSNSPVNTWKNVGYAYNLLEGQASGVGKDLIVHETWYSSNNNGAPGGFGSPQEQSQWYNTYVASGKPVSGGDFTPPFRFVWGEAFNQGWKKEPGNQGPFWGLNGFIDDIPSRGPKQVIKDLEATNPLVRFQLDASPSSVKAGVPFQLTITAENATLAGSASAWATANRFAGTVALVSSDGQAVTPATVTFTAADNGVKVIQVTLTRAGAITLTAAYTDHNMKGSTPVTVTPASATKMMTNTRQGAGGAPLLTVIPEDQFGNVATGYRGTIDFQSTRGISGLPASYQFTAVDSGKHTFALKPLVAAVGSVTVSGLGTVKVEFFNIFGLLF